MDHTKHSNLCTRGQLWRSSWLSIAVVSPQLYLSMSWTITQATPLFNHYHFATRYRFPWKVFCNEGSQLLKRTKEDIWLNFTDIKSKLNKDHQVIVKTYPVGAHNMNEKVGRKIREINQSLEKSIKNEQLSILQWETICSKIYDAWFKSWLMNQVPKLMTQSK